MISNVETKHPDFLQMLNRWEMVDDVCSGALKVKEQGEKYLPRTNCTDTSQHAWDLYNAYKERAVFFEVTKDTLQNHVGLAFSEDPNFKPDGLDFLKFDADGAGNSIYQLNQMALRGLLKRGRGGFFVDYPQTEKELTKADIIRENIRPTVIYYEAQNIINWRVKKVGSTFKTSLIVLFEQSLEADLKDEFNLIEVKTYRVLRLDDSNRFSVQIYSDKTGQMVAGEPYYPTKNNGSFWNEIPFITIGAQSNDLKVDSIPLESLALMNIAHYRNSAEYENSVFYTGQIQPVITNLDEQQAIGLEERGIKLGSYFPLTLWGDAKFEYVQAKEVMLAKEAMRDKFEYMQALGAKVLDKTSSVKTATQVTEEKATQHSVLSLCVSNLNEASEYYLNWCAEYSGFGFDAVFSIKQDFARGEITLDELKFYQSEVVRGAMSNETLHQVKSTGKLPEIDFNDEQLRIEQEQNKTI